MAKGSPGLSTKSEKWSRTTENEMQKPEQTTDDDDDDGK
jgi:hypothetical protein